MYRTLYKHLMHKFHILNPLTLLIDEDEACNHKWRVIRHKSIAEAGVDTEKRHKAAIYFYAQDYYKIFMGSGNDSSSFCSELVAKAYARAEIKIIDGKSQSKVTPGKVKLV